MKKIIYIALLAAFAAGCAKEAKTGVNENAIRYFQAWQKVNYPNADSTSLGAYIIEKEEGTGEAIKNEGYVIAEYTVSDLEGNISSYTNEETAKQLGAYSEIFYYGPKVININRGKVQVGIADILSGSKIGGRVKAAIPSWLMTTSQLGGKEDYMNTATESNNYIYDIKVVGFTEDINKWQVDSVDSYIKSHKDIFGDMTIKDTIKGISGIWYKQLKAPVDTTSFPKDTTIYINYTGKLLNGHIFDTTDERLAKDNGLYSPSKSYGPVKISWGEEASKITMGSGSTVINGFSLTLWQMRAMEKGIVIFTSTHGYGTSGSGQVIPPYSPLIFEIEIVAKPEK